MVFAFRARGVSAATMRSISMRAVCKDDFILAGPVPFSMVKMYHGAATILHAGITRLDGRSPQRYPYLPGSTGFGRCPIGTGNFNYGSRRFNAFQCSVRAPRSGALDEALSRRAREPAFRPDQPCGA